MCRRLSIVLAVMLVAVCAPYAHADSITDGTLYFTVTSGSLAPTASFVYDNTTSSFTSFTVYWDGVAFNFASLLTLTKLGSSGGWCAAAPNGVPACGFPASFDLNGFIETYQADTFLNLSAVAAGGYSVETTTPEPNLGGLVLLGLGAFAALRKSLRLATVGA
jgi:MYXO-CTERM domain-containing protein